MSTDDPAQNTSDPPMIDVSDPFFRYLGSPARKARNDFVNKVMGLQDLGIRKLSLTESADLVAVDMYGSGVIDVEVPERDGDEALRRNDPRVLVALAPQRKVILERLIESIANSSLKTAQTRRDLDTGAVDPDATFLDYDELHSWAEQFGYEPGDWMAEYSDEEGHVYGDLAEALFDIRNIRSHPSGVSRQTHLARQRVLGNVELDVIPEYADKTAQELREIVKGYAEEVAYLRGELKARATDGDGPALRPKSRNTLYRLIVALCIAVGLDPNARGAAATIAVLTQNVGLRVGDDTIRKILAELPEVGSD